MRESVCERERERERGGGGRQKAVRDCDRERHGETWRDERK